MINPKHAASDYFGHQMNMYQGDDHPQAGYRCEGGGPKKEESWRFGSAASESLFNEAVDGDGKFIIDFTGGLEAFTHIVLFIAGSCQSIIGPEWQERQMKFFSHAELVVIPNAGHEMFAENPEAAIAVVRNYLKSGE